MNNVAEYLKLWKSDSQGNCIPLSSYDLNKGIRSINANDKISVVKESLLTNKYIATDIYGNYELREKAQSIWKSLNHDIVNGDSDIIRGGEWSDFRVLLTYYIECVKQEERPTHVFYPNEENKKFFIPPSLPSSWLNSLCSDRENYELNIKYGNKNKSAIHKFYSLYDEDSTIYLGYPILATKSRNGNVLYYPIGIIPLNVSLTSKDITISNVNHISFDVNYLEATINYSLLDYYVPQEQRKGFLYKISNTHKNDGYQGLFDLYNALGDIEAEFKNNYGDEDIEPTFLSQFLPKSIDIREKKLCNTAVVYTEKDLRFTRVLAKELQHIRDDVSDRELDETSLAYIYRNPRLSRNKGDKRIGISFIESNSEQLKALETALNNPICKITGPPGTGKSQVATNIIANNIFYGDSILFASKNHKAVNAIRDRSDSLFDKIDENMYLVDFCADIQKNPNNPWYRKDCRTSIASKSIVNSKRNSLLKLKEAIAKMKSYIEAIELEENSLKDYYSSYNNYSIIKNELSSALYKDESEIQLSKEDFSTLVESRAQLENSSDKFAIRFIWKYKYQKGFEGALETIKRIAPELYNKTIGTNNLEEAKNKLQIIEKKYIEYFDALDEYNKKSEEKKNNIVDDSILEKYSEAFNIMNENSLSGFCSNLKETLNPLADNERLLDDIDSLRLKYKNRDSVKIIKLSNKNIVDNDIATFKKYLKINPAWATTLLSLKYSAPCLPGVFDSVIIDEAAQCDCISIIPAFFRAKKAIVMGDKQQLPPIVTIAEQRNDFLWDRLKLTGLEKYSYNCSSAFSVVPAKEILLKEHFRCAPDIAEIFDDCFYNNQLRVRTNESKLKFPKNCGYSCSVEWVDVKDDFEEEINASLEHVKKLIKNDYTGSIGIISPLKIVVDEVSQRLDTMGIDEEQVIAKTVASFQGSECDVIIFIVAYNNFVINQAGKLWYITDTTNAYIYNVAISRARALLLLVGDRDKCRNSNVKILKKIAASPRPRKAKVSDEPIFDSPWERNLYEALKAEGIQTITQYPLLGRKLDMAYVSEDIKIDIEVDGRTFHTNENGHRKMDDLFRDLQVTGAGWLVKRFWKSELENNMRECVEIIKEMIKNKNYIKKK